jgi:hypothetical protein
MMSLIFGSKTVQLRVNATVHGKGNFEEFDDVGWDVVKDRFLLVLDYFFERTDVLRTQDLDREDVTMIIAENQAIELKCKRHAMSM